MEKVRILIYGSTVLTSMVCREIEKYHNIIGYIPTVSPNFPGKMKKWKKLEKEPDKKEYDIGLSIQYDKKILNLDNCYNLHTGLLGDWGGCNILYHTVKSGVKEQGLTFHKITNKFDEGPIVSKITYPVFKEDDESDLYLRMLLVAPNLCLSSINLLKNIGIMNQDKINSCLIISPIIYKKNMDLVEEEKQTYQNMFFKIKNKLIEIGEINE